MWTGRLKNTWGLPWARTRRHHVLEVWPISLSSSAAPGSGAILILTAHLDEKKGCGITTLLLAASTQDQRRAQHGEQRAWLSVPAPEIKYKEQHLMQDFYWAGGGKRTNKSHLTLQQLSPTGCSALKAGYSFKSKPNILPREAAGGKLLSKDTGHPK